LASRTIANYRSDLVSFARFFEQDTGETFAAVAVTPTDVRAFRAHLRDVGCKPATVNRRLAAIRKFAQWAVASKRSAELATEGVKGVAAFRAGARWLAKRDADRLTRAVERYGKPRDVAIVAILRYAGLRVSELAGLRLSDLELSDRKGVVTVRSGKGGKFRQVPLNVEVRRAITRYLAIRPDVADDHLLIGQRRAGIQAQAIENVIAKYAYLAGLSGVSPHVLRHTFAKQLRDAGVDLETIRELLGHERLETTAIYTRPGERDLEAAVAALEEAA
jgi:integrase/recombinase XerD